MMFGDAEITREDMPSYQIGQEYPTRRWQFMQDTLNTALQKQGQLMNPNSVVEADSTNPNNAVQQSAWK